MRDRLAAGVLSGQSRVLTLRAEEFPDLARSVLRATGGETGCSQRRHASDALSLQAAQMTSPEMGSQMLLSPRAVEYHLHQVCRELDVRLRRELGDGAMPL